MGKKTKNQNLFHDLDNFLKNELIWEMILIVQKVILSIYATLYFWG